MDRLQEVTDRVGRVVLEKKCCAYAARGGRRRGCASPEHLTRPAAIAARPPPQAGKTRGRRALSVVPEKGVEPLPGVTQTGF